MEYLEGQTLAQRLAHQAGSKDPALPMQEALSYGIQIADALDKAHRHGITHRDLKPANIFITRSGGPSGPPIAKLLDFGLAKTAAVGPANRLRQGYGGPPKLHAEAEAGQHRGDEGDIIGGVRLQADLSVFVPR